VSKKDAVIFDLNNTLRKKSGKPRHHILKKAQKAEHKEGVVVLTGESNEHRFSDRDWLNKHGLEDAHLDMRPRGDKEPDASLKAKELKKDVSRQFKVNKAYDDKPANVKMFKKHGINAKEV
jgi:FMN phosphatase YigB (HAD superfamily)